MEIAITSTGADLEAEVDQRFGRARNFIIVDVETGDFEVIDNAQNVSAAQGAGVQAAMNIAGKGVAYLLTGHCGPNAFRTLGGAGVKVITGVSGTVKEAVARFKNGEFEEVDAPDVEGHWT
jgi:predicted Fe-Mo cluster-binding NifX family protein